jgi:hypothetical protein
LYILRVTFSGGLDGVLNTGSGSSRIFVSEGVAGNAEFTWSII